MNLEIKIKKEYDSFLLDIEVRFNKGIVSIFGPSGCGKTTLLNCISGIIEPDNGKIKFNNRYLFSKEKQINIPINKRKLGYIFQKLYLFDHLTVRDNLIYGYKNNNIKFDEVIHILNIKEILKLMPKEISHGQAQRVAIGRSILSEPEILLMDEPLSALDLITRIRILDYIKKIHSKFNIPIIYVSHNIEEIEYLNSDILLLDNGKILSYGTISEIFKKHTELILQPFINNHVSIISGKVLKKDKGYSIVLVNSNKKLKVKDNSLNINDNVSLIIKANDVKCSSFHLPDMAIANIYCGIVDEILNINENVIIKINAGFIIYSKMMIAEYEKLKIKKESKIHFFFSSDNIKVYSKRNN